MDKHRGEGKREEERQRENTGIITVPSIGGAKKSHVFTEVGQAGIGST